MDQEIFAGGRLEGDHFFPLPAAKGEAGNVSVIVMLNPYAIILSSLIMKSETVRPPGYHISEMFPFPRGKETDKESFSFRYLTE